MDQHDDMEVATQKRDKNIAELESSKQPCYIPGSPILGDAIQEILAQHFLNDVRKESITRALLLSTYTPEQLDAAIKQAVDATSKNVLELLSPMGSDEAFHKDVEALFCGAAGVWREAQHKRKGVEARMTDHFNDWQWSYLDDFTVAEIRGQQPGLRKFDMLNLFPRVFVPEENHVVNPGFVLWPEQNTVFAAEQELREYMAPRRSKGGWIGNIPGGSTRRGRRLSTLPVGRNGAIESSPTFLKNDDKAPIFRLQRGHKQGSQIQNGHRGEG
ncbi:MAG: hypothetical protein M1827_007543 [Pycnora praestabilis]|nr:MAG: hypothetical protein M1827_007543 [Pycnora praestabilis]